MSTLPTLCITGKLRWPYRKKETPFENKNVFQWDAYRPLVDRIPALDRGEGVHPSMHWAGGGCIPACIGQGGVYPCMHWAGGCLARGVSTQGGGFPGRGDVADTPLWGEAKHCTRFQVASPQSSVNKI